MIASVLAAIRNSGVPIAATPSKTGSTSIETALTGPVARCREDPHSEPTIAATTAAYRPYWGGSSAIDAYAIDWGMATAATVTPATRSGEKSCLLVAPENVDRTTQIIDDTLGRLGRCIVSVLRFNSL